jgi:hypothetical protein
MTRSRITIADICIVAAAILIVVHLMGCAAGKLEVIHPDGTRVNAEAVSFFQKLDLADAKWKSSSSPTTRSIDAEIGKLSRDQTAAKEVLIEAIKKIP